MKITVNKNKSIKLEKEKKRLAPVFTSESQEFNYYEKRKRNKTLGLRQNIQI